MYWFDIREGKMIVGDAAYESIVEESGPGDIVPLADLIKSDDFSFDPDIFGPQEYTRYDKEELITIGHWILKVLSVSDPETHITERDLIRFSKIRLSMSTTAVHSSFGSIAQFNIELGRPNFSPYHTYTDWEHDDFVRNAEMLADKLGRKPLERDYTEWARAGNGPGPQIVSQKFPGGFRQLNDAIGYPDIHSWDQHDYIDWGLRFVRVNGALPTTTTTDLLSKRKRGPSARAVGFEFDDFKSFQAEILESLGNECQFRLDEAWLEAEFKELRDTAPGERKKRLSPQQMRSVLARHAVAKECLPGLEPAKLAEIALTANENTFVAKIKKFNPKLTAGQIELLASSRQYLDDIWPSTSPDHKHLSVSEQELAREQKRQADKKKRERERKRQLRLNSEPAPNQAVEQ